MTIFRGERRRTNFRATGTQVPGRTLPSGSQWTGSEIPGRGAAAKRRLKQMANGILPRICASCLTNPVPRDRAVRACDACLEKQWGGKSS